MWCYTTDPDTVWELCDPIGWKKEEPCDYKNENLKDYRDAGYRGCQTKTISGKKCLDWDTLKSKENGD